MNVEIQLSSVTSHKIYVYFYFYIHLCSTMPLLGDLESDSLTRAQDRMI